jgi:hypothetical protein
MPNDSARLGNSSPLLNTMTLIEHSIVVLLVVLTVLWPFTIAILLGTTLAIATNRGEPKSTGRLSA